MKSFKIVSAMRLYEVDKEHDARLKALHGVPAPERGRSDNLSALWDARVDHRCAVCCQVCSGSWPLLQSLSATCPAGVYLYCPPVNVVSGCCSPFVEPSCVRHHVCCASLYVRLCPGLCPQTVYSPNSLLFGSLLEEKGLAAICSGCVPGACLPLSALCPPRVRFGRASKPCPPPVSASCVHHVFAMCPLFVRHAPALCQLRSTMCPRLWTLSAMAS